MEEDKIISILQKLMNEFYKVYGTIGKDSGFRTFYKFITEYKINNTPSK